MHFFKTNLSITRSFTIARSFWSHLVHIDEQTILFDRQRNGKTYCIQFCFPNAIRLISKNFERVLQFQRKCLYNIYSSEFWAQVNLIRALSM